jgi:hypothetical protein
MEKPDYLSQNAHLRDVALEVAALIEECRGHEMHVELEGRIGLLGSKGFRGNISSSCFQNILLMLESFPRWSHVDDWSESQDVCYIHNGTQVRTRVTYGEEISVSHITKKRIGNVDMRLHSLDTGACALATSHDGIVYHLDARVSASIEEVISDVPSACRPNLVRIKQRKSFYLSSLGIDGDAFCFDMTMCWMGSTKTEAEEKQATCMDTLYEVEVECLDMKKYLDSCGNDAICLALSLILKLHDFVAALNSQMSVTFLPVKCEFKGRGLM